MKKFKYNYLCKKVSYLTEEYAKRVLEESLKKGYGKIRSIYKCPKCNLFHTTKQLT